MAAGRIAGVAYIKIDGIQYSLRGSFKVNPTTSKREGIAGMDGVHGYKESPTVPSMQGEFSDIGTLSLVTLQGITASTITAELANGVTYIASGAWWAGEGEIDADEGRVQFKFEAAQIIEDMA